MKDSEYFQNFEFCCDLFRNNITLESNMQIGQVIVYDPQVRMFAIMVIKNKDAISPINYCPYCGKKLPNELMEEWSSIVQDKFCKDYMNMDRPEREKFFKKLPEEFKTDEWWKKRGL
jgi:hypothetical protein